MQAMADRCSRLERHAGKLACAVLRGRGASNGLLLPDKSHWVRDVTFDEDRSQVRCGNIPEVMAALRNLAIGLIRLGGDTNIAAACRRYAAQPWAALALLGIQPKTE